MLKGCTIRAFGNYLFLLLYEWKFFLDFHAGDSLFFISDIIHEIRNVRVSILMVIEKMSFLCCWGKGLSWYRIYGWKQLHSVRLSLVVFSIVRPFTNKLNSILVFRCLSSSESRKPSCLVVSQLCYMWDFIRLFQRQT